MGSEVRRPGMPPGLDAMVEKAFGVPRTPSIGRAEAARRVREHLTREKLACERLDISELPVARGALFDMSGARVPFPEGKAYDTSYVALVDPEARAQWGHRAWWAFVPVDGDGEVVLQPTEFPENALGSVRFFGEPQA